MLNVVSPILSLWGNHISRANIPDNADPSKTHLNQHLVEHGDNIMKAIDKRIQDGYKGKTAIRKDAVKALSMVLTGTHEQMSELEKTGQLDIWIQSNQEWLELRYGKKNIISLALHMDERTPHLHAVVVPLTGDGRLSAKDVLGNKVKMQQMQSDYAHAMELFGLQRGKEGSRATHEDVKEYYTRLNLDLPKVKDELAEKKEELKEIKKEIRVDSAWKMVTGVVDAIGKRTKIDAKDAQISILTEKVDKLTTELERVNRERLKLGDALSTALTKCSNAMEEIQKLKNGANAAITQGMHKVIGLINEKLLRNGFPFKIEGRGNSSHMIIDINKGNDKGLNQNRGQGL